MRAEGNDRAKRRKERKKGRERENERNRWKEEAARCGPAPTQFRFSSAFSSKKNKPNKTNQTKQTKQNKTRTSVIPLDVYLVLPSFHLDDDPVKLKLMVSPVTGARFGPSSLARAKTGLWSLKLCRCENLVS